MARQLRSQGAPDLTLALQPRKRRRKNRWHTAKGKVVGVRFTDAEYQMVDKTARAEGLSPGAYLKQMATRSKEA